MNKIHINCTNSKEIQDISHEWRRSKDFSPVINSLCNSGKTVGGENKVFRVMQLP